MLAAACLTAALAASALPTERYACAGAAAGRGYAWCNASLATDARVAALVAALTLDEKAGQMQARSSAAVPRLGVPAFCWGMNAVDRIYANDVRGTTIFPPPSSLGAAFNDSAVEAMAAVFATEARALFNAGEKGGGYMCPGSVSAWAPTININRDPRWGRNWESYGEDPLLVGRAAAAYVRGAAGEDDPRYTKMVVTIKHFAAYSLDNYNGTDRYDFDAVVSDADLNETYFPAFQAGIDAGAAGVMCSYNSVNGVPACMNPALRDALRGRFGFRGYVVSDTDAISTENNHHHYVHTDAERVVRAVVDGETDMESSVGSTNLYVTLVPTLVRNGSLPEALVDAAVARILTPRFNAGLFDSPDQPYARITKAALRSASHLEAAQDAARQVVTLLQNRGGVLPFPKGGRVAVVGPHAARVDVAKPKEWYHPGIADGVRAVNPEADVTEAAGCTLQGASKAGFAAAVAAAQAADYVVLALGTDSAVEREYKDRVATTLSGVQDELAAAVLAVGKPTAVMLVSLGAPAVDALKASADAILLGYTPDGRAPAEVIFGDTNPSGKLPFTMYPAAFAARTDFKNMSMHAGDGRGKYYTGTPLWPFGYGLSYTTFVLGRPACAPSDGAVACTLTLSNTGARGGAEVVQVYRRAAPAVKTLVGYTKVYVEAGQSAEVSLRIAAADAPHGEQLLFTNGAGAAQTLSLPSAPQP